MSRIGSRYRCLIACAMLLSVVSAARAEYRGPVQFRPPIFTNIRPQTIQQARLPRTTIVRENIRPQTIPRTTISRTTIPRENIPRETFRFDSSIFGFVNDGPPRAPGSNFIDPSQRTPSRRRQLGW